jgi:hypothetical protein
MLTAMAILPICGSAEFVRRIIAGYAQHAAFKTRLQH